MKLFAIPLILLALFSNSVWEKDFESAKKKAKDQHKLILLEFSGSDWCGPCIRFRKEVLESEAFTSYASSELVLLNADFPRLSKNQLSKDQQKKNDKLADKFNPEGIFPLTLLLDEEGKKLKVWEGYPGLTAEEFISQVKSVSLKRD